MGNTLEIGWCHNSDELSRDLCWVMSQVSYGMFNVNKNL